MARLLLLLPLCLPLAPAYPQEPEPPVPNEDRRVGPAFQPALLAFLAGVPEAAFPAALPWPALGQAGRLATSSKPPLPNPDPVEFLKMCLARYDREVQGYSLIMYKRERINGRLQPREIIQCYFKEHPFSVFLRWLEGKRLVQSALYVQGQNNGKLVALPVGALALLGTFEKSPDGEEARQSGRYPINEFGLKIATQRVLDSWLAARAEHALHVEYLGVFRVPDAGDRACYKLRRTRYAQPEADGITDLTLYIDCENWLQVGSVLKGVHDELIAEYYFRDIHLNPTFAPHQFDRSALKP
jgi:Protein of unknown function (DUF1571)